MSFLVLNDAIVPAETASLPVTTEGLRYGSGCFETIAYAGGAPRFWRRHMERFSNSCVRLGLTPKVQPARLWELLGELAAKNTGLKDGVVRVSAHQHGSEADIVMTLTPPRYAKVPESLRVMQSVARHPGPWALSGIKHNNYAQLLAAGVEATAAGFDEALLADCGGQLLEGSRTNLFSVSKLATGWRICTAPLESGVLPGVMRAVVLELAPQLGIGVAQEAFCAEQLRGADGCFVTNALMGVVAVSQFGDHFFDAESNVLISTLRHAVAQLKA